METCVVGIASVEAKPINTKRGPSTVYNVSDDLGIEYTTFDRDIAAAAGVRKGRQALLTFNVKQNTKPNRDGQNVTYTNRYLESVEDTAEDIGPLPATEVFGTAPESPVVGEYTNKDQSIARAVALKAAVELVTSGVVESVGGSPIKGGDVILLAKYLEPYLLGYDAPTETSVGDEVPF